jgi:general secretion pathway protein F
MSAFRYQALTKSGHTTKGIIKADSAHQARQFLRDRGLIPTHTSPFANQKVRRNMTVSAANLSLLTRQLATLIAAGIPVDESLTGVSEQTEKTVISELIIAVRNKLLEGYSLAQAMNEFPYAFPELYRATVGAGEQSGRLDIVLEKLADYTENQQTTRQKIQQALIYPLLMVIVSTTIISFLLTFVVPKIIEVFTSSGQSLPRMTQLLIIISNAIKTYGGHAFFISLIAIIAFRYSLKTIAIRTKWHAWLLRLPICAYLVRSTNVARYIHTFGILFTAGVSVLETMRVSASVVDNLVMRSAFDTAAIKVREGIAIGNALKSSGFLSPMTIHLISSGEKSGQIASMMERAALHMDTEVKQLIDTALALLEPLVILFMGGVVLFIVLATLLPIFSMEQLVT